MAQPLSDRGAPMRSHTTRQNFKKLGIDQLFRRPRAPNDNRRTEAHCGTVKFHPVYPGCFTEVRAALTYFTGFYGWYNDLHPLTNLGMLMANQVHSGQATTILAARQPHRAEAPASRRKAKHAPLTLEKLNRLTLT
jgi:putative transposase